MHVSTAYINVINVALYPKMDLIVKLFFLMAVNVHVYMTFFNSHHFVVSFLIVLFALGIDAIQILWPD